MKRLFNKQRGDTIIEVFLAMAVIGLSLGISYGIANRATLTGRLAQERTEASKLAETQIELMKGYISAGEISKDEYRDTEPYCITQDDPKVQIADLDPGEITVCSFTSGSTYYQWTMTWNSAEDTFLSYVFWEVPNSRELARVEFVYRP